MIQVRFLSGLLNLALNGQVFHLDLKINYNSSQCFTKDDLLVPSEFSEVPIFRVTSARSVAELRYNAEFIFQCPSVILQPELKLNSDIQPGIWSEAGISPNYLLGTVRPYVGFQPTDDGFEPSFARSDRYDKIHTFRSV